LPFTFSHPAIILPLTFLPKKYFSLTGLVIGSLTPDFEYFLRMEILSIYSHTFLGLFWFDLPLGILLTFIFHNIVRNSLYNNLPKFLKSRLFHFTEFNWNNYFKNNWIVIITSVLIGSFSHIFWDGFTHEHGYFVEQIQLLTSKVNLFGIQFSIFKILQHMSSLIGGLIICFTIFKLKPNEIYSSALNINYWITFGLLSLGIIFIRLNSGLDFRMVGHLVATSISAGLISLVLVSLIYFDK
jgi:hypothetical protein